MSQKAHLFDGKQDSLLEQQPPLPALASRLGKRRLLLVEAGLIYAGSESIRSSATRAQ